MMCDYHIDIFVKTIGRISFMRGQKGHVNLRFVRTKYWDKTYIQVEIMCLL